MDNSLMLADSCILLAGSISSSTANTQIDKAHTFVEALVKEVIDAGGAFVAYFAAEPVNANNRPLLFDWTVARTIDRIIPGESPKIRLKIVASHDRLKTKANPEQRQLLYGMIARGIAELIPLDEEVLTGGNVGDEQTEHATAMIVLGGGKGVTDRTRKMTKKSLPVIPLDLQLGANSEDGTGALGVLNSFLNNPLIYMPFSGNSVVKILPVLSLQEPVLEFSDIAKRIVTLFYQEELARISALPPDVLVLTALPIELAAAKQALGIAPDTPPTTTSTGLHTWKVPINRRDGRVASCMVACFATAGNVDAATVTATLLTKYEPRNVMMMGIAAGMREKCALAEVIFAERVVAYGGMAVLQGGTNEPRPEMTRLSFRSRQDLATYLSDTSGLEQRLTHYYERMDIVLPANAETGPVAQSVIPKVTTVASGECLIRDPDKFRQLRELHGKIETAEMEGAGVYAACETHNKPILMVRGISDFGDSTKDNRFHHWAAQAAAAVTVDYIAHGLTLEY